MKETLAAMEPPEGPSMSVAEEFKAIVHGTLTSSQPIRVPTPTKDHPLPTNEVEMKASSVLPLIMPKNRHTVVANPGQKDGMCV